MSKVESSATRYQKIPRLELETVTCTVIDKTFVRGVKIVGIVLGHCYHFQGHIKHKRGILGYRIALSTFDNDYLLRNIH